MQIPDISQITIDKLDLPYLSEKKIHLEMLRLDKIHPVISGNKWFKLKYHLEEYYKGNYKGIVTFGGAWSNHIVATACAAYNEKIKAVGIIRGEKPVNKSSTLVEAETYNMDLRFVPREVFRDKHTETFINELQKKFPDHYIIPEGGAGAAGEKGAGEILNLLPENDYTHISCAIGTATMFHGISKSAKPDQKILGIVVMKGWESMKSNKTELCTNFHFGGYAKITPALLSFMNEFYLQTGIPTDFVYTAKLTFGVNQLMIENYFPKDSKVLIIHSGGLQGNSSLQKGSLIF